jgi:hypothetical protein
MDYLQKAFDKKYVFCGDYCYLKEYSKPHLLGIKRSENAVKGKDNESGKLKRYDNLKRARDSVAQIVYSNLTPHTKFLTLTTAETVLNKIFISNQILNLSTYSISKTIFSAQERLFLPFT